jgi:hypothetical protein
MRTPLTLPLKTISEANASQREHWASKHKRHATQRQLVKVCLLDAWGPRQGPWSAPVTLALTRISPRILDGDNLQAALKHVRDEVAAWFGLDDAHPLLTWEYAQRQSRGQPRGNPYYAVEIRLRRNGFAC